MRSLCLLACLVWPVLVFAAVDDPKNPAFFAANIEPIFREHCFKCHSHASEKIKGGLVLDSRAAALAGGDTGPAIVPGNPEKSLLLEAISYKNEDLQMPPKGRKLTDQQIALLNQWVKHGAAWPEPAGQKMAIRPKGKITDEDRAWWAFQPVSNPQPPEVVAPRWAENEIDRFIFARLQNEQLEPAPAATPAQLIRRLYFNVIGLPPTPEETAAFVEDCRDASPPAIKAAIAALVDRLLASPHYGEHWARHWLDLVRYAESDGFKIDEYRPNAWRYRDYVIRAFNEDKPYDRFVQEQLAGDELFPTDLGARVATAFFRHGIYEYNNRDAAGQWTNILNDITDVTADVFLGLGVQCARCHDHKFDPILQKDYYRLQAFFAPLLPIDNARLATPEELGAHAAKLKDWEEKTAELRAQIAAIEEPAKRKAAADAISKFPPETQALIRKPVKERNPWEHQVAELAFRQVLYEWDNLVNKMRGPDKDKVVSLQKRLAVFDREKPAPLPEVPCAIDVGPEAPPTTIPKKEGAGRIEPGFLTLLEEKPAAIEPALPNSTGRRATLARWLTNPKNPLTARVIVNRVWQYHFGRGLVGTASDFGKLGDQPSHPELLDWLTRRFIADGWSIKKLHRRILLSAAYQQSTANPAAEMARVKDPENRLLWRATTRRLSAEQIRDAILAVTGELKLELGGPSVDWAEPRRTIYTKVKRNTRDPLLEVFDVPEGFTSVSQRDVTTTPTQSLLMFNSSTAVQRAKAFARRLQSENSSDPDEIIDDAFRRAFARDPSGAERERARRFLEQQSALISPPKTEAAVAPFASEKMLFRDGRAALFTPGGAMERLTVSDQPFFPAGDLTIEAFINLNSCYEDGQVRTIAAHWDGSRTSRGWSLGVTGKQSRYKPQTLVLLLNGDQPWSARDPVEPVFSGLHIAVGKPYFVAVSIDLDDPTGKGITFYAKDLANDDEPMQVATIKHTVTSGIRSGSDLTIGARGAGSEHLFDGLIDDVRLSNAPLAPEQLLLNNAGVTDQTVGYWKFDSEPGVYRDSSPRGADITPRMIEPPKTDPRTVALVDFCHTLLNSNEFLYLD